MNIDKISASSNAGEYLPAIIAGSGGGGGGGSSGGMYEAPDSLLSKATVSIVDLLGEGQIGGLVAGAQSVYFNDVPVQNADGTWNFSVPDLLDPVTGKLLPVTFSYQFRDGQQNQAVMQSFSDVETPYSVGVRVQHGTPAVISVANSNSNAVKLIVSIPALTSQDPVSGSIYGTSVSFQFMVSVNLGPYTTLSGPLTINGKSRSKYQVSYLYNLPKLDANGIQATRWEVKLVRLTPDSTSSMLNNDTWLDSYVEIMYANLSYPNSAVIGYTLDSSQFSSIPKRSYLVNGLYIQVPSNYDPVARTYTGIWDGTFKVAISNNPAWVLYDLLVNERYGLGQFIMPTQVDKAKLYQIGQYCDGMVSDGFGGLEPRYTINAYITNRQDAYMLMQSISSVFNGLTFWAGGIATFMQDSPDTPVMAYTPSNVVDGVFNYTGTSRKDRHSAVLVAWTDPSQYYKQTIEYVEDQTLIAKYGLKTKNITAFGCTSRGQAHRAGLWTLYSEEYQSNLITFAVGTDSALVVPGEIVQIHDTTRAGKRLGGRLISCTATSATLDAPVTLSDGATATLSLRMPDGTFVENVLNQSNSSTPVSTVTWQTALTTLPVANAIWIISETNLQPMLARVVAVTQGKAPGQFEIAAIEHNPNKYGYVESGLTLVQPKLSDINIIPTAPTGLAVTDATYISGSNNIVKMTISWDRTQTGVVSWNVKVRDTTTGGNVVSYDTNFPAQDVENVIVGHTYTISVMARSALGVNSAPVSTTYTVIGKAVPPPDVQNLTISTNGNKLILTWQAVNIVDIAGYSVRQNGVDWNTAIAVATIQSNQITIGAIANQEILWRVKAFDKYGNYSTNEATVTQHVLSSQISNLTEKIVGNNFTLSWADSVDPNIISYVIMTGETFLAASIIGKSLSSSYSGVVDWSGIRTFWVVPVDGAGNYGSQASVDVFIVQPGAASVTLDNLGNAIITFPGYVDPNITGYEMRIGGTSFGTGTLFLTSAIAKFTVPLLSVAGNVFWIAAKYVAGGYSQQAYTLNFSNTALSPPNNITWRISEPDIVFSWDSIVGAVEYLTLFETNGVTNLQTVSSNSVSYAIPRSSSVLRVVAVTANGGTSPYSDETLDVSGQYIYNEILNVPISITGGNYVNMAFSSSNTVVKPGLLGIVPSSPNGGNMNAVDCFGLGYDLSAINASVYQNTPASWFRQNFWNVQNGYFESSVTDLGFIATGKISISLTKTINYVGDLSVSNYLAVSSAYLSESTPNQITDDKAFVNVRIMIASDSANSNNWTVVNNGDWVSGRYVKITATVVMTSPLTEVDISAGSIYIDVPDISETGTVANVTTSGAVVTLTKTYHHVDVIMATCQGNAQAYIPSRTLTNFSVTTTSTSGVNVDYFVKGY